MIRAILIILQKKEELMADKPLTKNQIIKNKFTPASIFLLLALFYSDMSNLFRYTMAAASLAFAIEGIIKLRKVESNNSD